MEKIEILAQIEIYDERRNLSKDQFLVFKNFRQFFG